MLKVTVWILFSQSIAAAVERRGDPKDVVVLRLFLPARKEDTRTSVTNNRRLPTILTVNKLTETHGENCMFSQTLYVCIYDRTLSRHKTFRQTAKEIVNDNYLEDEI